ncbi:MAG: hypothetical protein LBD14_00855 [Puniceicoccales bacterium]|nr:hypothetical protein [Puniceicoccales bacterium]
MTESNSQPPPETNAAQAPRTAGRATTASQVSVAPLGGALVSLSAPARPGESADALLARLLEEGRHRGLSVVQGNVFGDTRRWQNTAAEFPLSILARHDSPPGDLRGARVLALPDGSFERLPDATGNLRCVRWETGGARYLLMGALTPGNHGAAPDAQSAELWRLLKATMEPAGFCLKDLVRTWFFNDRILDWYDGFNRVRTAFFNEHDIFGSLVPASTGVGAANATGAALTLDALAVVPREGAQLEVSAVASPLQGPANDYKSAFSRAVEVAEKAGRHLFISGTASIEPHGLTAHHDDLDAQIKLSLRVVAAILEARNMTWADVARAILYFPETAWMARFEPCREALGIPPLPAIFAHCDICRGDLLFEIELDAFKDGVK